MNYNTSLPYEQYIANIINRALTYIEVPVEETKSINVYIATRNQSVLDHFGIFDFPFKEFDVSTKQIQAIDVLTGKPAIIQLPNAQNVYIPGDPNLLSPPSIGNPLFFDQITEKDIADIQLLFCISIKQLKDAGYLYETTTNVPADLFKKILRFQYITKTLNFEIEPDIASLMSDYIHSMCNKRLHEYIDEEKYDLLTMRYIVSNATEEIKDIPLNTFKEIENFLSDTEKVITVWKKFIERLIDERVVEYNKEYETVISDITNLESREREFIKLQYDKAISDLKEIDVDGALHKFGNETRLILRYLPNDIKTPEGLLNVRMFSTYENTILGALIGNGVNVHEKDLKFDYINTIMRSNGIDDISVQLNANYIEQIREIRLKQIIKHADELVKTVESEADELDEEDLLEILASIRDYETYRQRLEEYSDISSIVQYWPSILLPAPAYAVRLDSKHQRPLILQLQA